MSKQAEAWQSERNRKPYGSRGAPPACVEIAPCSVCGAKPGELCQGVEGPTLGTHYVRNQEAIRIRRERRAAGHQ